MYPPQLNGGDRAFYPQPEGHSFYPSDRYAQPLPHWVLAAPHWVPTTHWVPVLVSDASQMTVMAPPVVGLPTNPMPMPSSPVIPVPAPQWAQPRWAPPVRRTRPEPHRSYRESGCHSPADRISRRVRSGRLFGIIFFLMLGALAGISKSTAPDARRVSRAAGAGRSR